jgi:Zn finger protein HypA/HybF involved in hydrogenase expression
VILLSCVLLVHKCADCRKDFLGSWQEWFCPSCKGSRRSVQSEASRVRKRERKIEGYAREAML